MAQEHNSILGTCKVDSKNRITLSPQVVRELKLLPGDLVSIENHNGFVCLLKAYICVKRNKTHPTNCQPTGENE